MQLLLKDRVLMEIENNGTCTILDFEHLPFALRHRDVTLIDFVEWASGRTLSIGRSYAKQILNTLKLSQNNRFAVCRACRGLSLEDSFWIRQDGDHKTWEEVNLFHNPLSLFITEISLSGRNAQYQAEAGMNANIHTPELTTLGASAKGWIRRESGLYLHKVGRYEIAADQILDAVGIEHVPYSISSERDISSYLSEERKQWLDSVGEVMVNSKLYTTEDRSMVTFEEFRVFCSYYGLNPYEEAMRIDRTAYLKMQIADYILNNNDRHEQNWGFFMDNETGKITGYCPLFDHDHAFSAYPDAMSQTTEEDMTLFQAAFMAQKELNLDLGPLEGMECPQFLEDDKWKQVLMRKRQVMTA